MAGQMAGMAPIPNQGPNQYVGMTIEQMRQEAARLQPGGNVIHNYFLEVVVDLAVRS
jgi:hypothetical protein